jgi:F0F1-type ATP synthase assembly protein I
MTIRPPPLPDSQTVIEVTPVNPTPPAMQAVTIESRVAALESQLRELTGTRPALLAELRAEIAGIRADCQVMIVSALAEEAKKREALETRLANFEKKVDDVAADASFTRAETTKQTASIQRTEASVELIKAAVVPVAKTVGTALDTPIARKLLGAIGVAILATIATWLASKGFRLPQ